MTDVTIGDARKICEKVGARGVIVLSFSAAAFSAASYGQTKAECRQVGKLLDRIVSMLASGDLKAWEGQ